MCGIAGFAARTLPESALESVRAMTDSMARRGPDGEGVHAWPNAVFGHRRLAIFDLSDAGRQPMLSSDAQVGVVFNGAIYNFPELRAELEQRGHRFRSQTDTEILVEGYLAWGIDDLIARLRGMFAFALWDNRSAALYLVRDRLGVKPLLYFEDGNAVIFASTAAALRASGCVDELDDRAMLEFLEFGFVADRHAIFRGARKLAAGHLLEWRNGVSRVRAYWSLPPAEERAGQDSKIGFEEAVEETQRLLLDSVKVRLFADVPVGALLSAGIDSTLICWATSKLNADIKSYSVGAPGDPADESVQAAATARQLGIPHQIIELPADRPPSLDDLTSAYAEPFACSSALGMLSVCQAVKPAVTVLLTGDGGDDVFLGYPYQRHMWMAQRAARALPRSAASLWPALRPLVDHLPGLRRPKHFLDYATGGLGAVTRVHDGFPYYLRSGLLGDRLAGFSPAQRDIPLSFDSARNLLPEVLAYQQDTVFTGEFMTKVDGGAMHYALEARSPLLDQRVWEFAARLPFSLRLRGGELKAVLREIVRRQVSPEVACRPKRGFTVPVERWLATRWRAQLEAMLDTPLLQREGWIRPGALEPLIRSSLARRRAPVQLWYLVVLENWLRHKATTVSPRPAPVLC
jgi:asparagine synthase (glutamine-hydrolysing)